MMNRTFLALLMATGLTMAVNAQDTAGKGKHARHQNLTVDEKVKRHTDKAEKDLGLNADQKLKWEQAMRERMAANQLLKDKLAGSTTPEERKALRSQAKANDDKFDASVSAFLTSDQKAKHAAVKKERMQKMHAHRKGGSPGDQQSPVIRD